MYFGRLGHPGHEWWPVSLFPLILPWSAVHQFLLDPILTKWLIPQSGSVPDSAWMELDYITGAYYIIVGTIWFWIVGKIILRIFSRARLLNEERKQAFRTPGEVICGIDSILCEIFCAGSR